MVRSFRRHLNRRGSVGILPIYEGRHIQNRWKEHRLFGFLSREGREVEDKAEDREMKDL